MTPEPPHASSWARPPEFYIDENLAGRTIRRAVADLGYKVHTPAEIFGQERLRNTVDDDEWLPEVGRHGWAVFLRDTGILKREHEVDAYLAARTHLFYLPGEIARQEILRLMRINLSAVCAAATAQKPSLYWLTSSGLVGYEQQRRRLERERRRRERRRRLGR